MKCYHSTMEDLIKKPQANLKTTWIQTHRGNSGHYKAIMVDSFILKLTPRCQNHSRHPKKSPIRRNWKGFAQDIMLLNSLVLITQICKAIIKGCKEPFLKLDSDDHMINWFRCILFYYLIWDWIRSALFIIILSGCLNSHTSASPLARVSSQGELTPVEPMKATDWLTG